MVTIFQYLYYDSQKNALTNQNKVVNSFLTLKARQRQDVHISTPVWIDKTKSPNPKQIFDAKKSTISLRSMQHSGRICAPTPKPQPTDMKCHHTTHSAWSAQHCQTVDSVAIHRRKQRCGTRESEQERRTPKSSEETIFTLSNKQFHAEKRWTEWDWDRILKQTHTHSH